MLNFILFYLRLLMSFCKGGERADRAYSKARWIKNKCLINRKIWFSMCQGQFTTDRDQLIHFDISMKKLLFRYFIDHSHRLNYCMLKNLSKRLFSIKKSVLVTFFTRFISYDTAVSANRSIVVQWRSSYARVFEWKINE